MRIHWTLMMVLCLWCLFVGFILCDQRIVPGGLSKKIAKWEQTAQDCSRTLEKVQAKVFKR